MNSTRLFVLGALARGGPMHGHQIRRAAQVDRTELWSDVKPGSLYGALHRMQVEGVIEAVRTEQEGNRPARTIYALTSAGAAELIDHRDEALRDTKLRHDPVDLALQNVIDLGEDELRGIIVARRKALAAQLDSWLALRELAAPHIRGLEWTTFRHTELRLRTELAWHDELLDQLPKLMANQPTSMTGS
ncbi:PadR family transcriptional regulator [Micromonospora trifolii]|uniref:PadR family transcriptional regulator n=1 Tax=Micromonospora trifolii TaxID=2911208 RepID=UPI003CEE0716